MTYDTRERAKMAFDVTTTPPTDGDALVWDNTNSEWIPGTSGIGVGQTWQDMTSSRTEDVTYTNNTGRPIYLAIYFYRAAGAMRGITINGTFLVRAGSTASQNSITLTCIIPDGDTYELDSELGLVSWYELR